MLSLLLVLTASTTPSHLPLPSRPEEIAIWPSSVQFASFTTKLDDLKMESRTAQDESNYRRWRENGFTWADTDYKTLLPTKAAQVRHRNTVARRHYEENDLLPYHPWQISSQEQAAFLQRHCGSAIGYAIRQEPSDYQRDYVAVIEAAPYITVRARTMEELEKKVIDCFAAFMENLSAFSERQPARRRETGGFGVCQDGIVP